MSCHTMPLCQTQPPKKPNSSSKNTSRYHYIHKKRTINYFLSPNIKPKPQRLSHRLLLSKTQLDIANITQWSKVRGLKQHRISRKSIQINRSISRVHNTYHKIVSNLSALYSLRIRTLFFSLQQAIFLTYKVSCL